MESTNIALIVGITGIVGSSLLQAMLATNWKKIYGTGLRSRPNWLPEPAEYIQCNLTDKEDTHSKLSGIGSKVTHIFWATWAPQSINGKEYLSCFDAEYDSNVSMMKNFLEAILVDSGGCLQHICLTTGARHYLQLSGPIRKPPFCEDLPRALEGGKHHKDWYFTQEDLVFEACNRLPGVTWSVHRPNMIIGFAPRNTANMLGRLATYATICKQLGLKFMFPGSRSVWGLRHNFSDARLIAEQELWAATGSGDNVKCNAYNVVNGDEMSWAQIWEAIVKELNMEDIDYLGDGNGFSMEEFMSNKGDVWKTIAQENELIESDLGKGWWMCDFGVAIDFPLWSSTDKCRRHGFTSTVNTQESVGYWVRKLIQEKAIPDEAFWKSRSSV